MKCEVIIDASVEEVAAYHFLLMSRKFIKLTSGRTIIRDAIKNNDHSNDFLNVIDHGFNVRRKYLMRQIWEKVDDVSGKIIIAFDDIKSSKLLDKYDAAKLNYTKALSTGLYEFEPASADGTFFKKTKLTYISQVNVGGNVPHQVVEMGAAGFFTSFIAIRKLYCKDYEIDLARREALLVKLRDSADEYEGLEEKSVIKIEEAKTAFRNFERAMGKRVMIETNNDFVSAVGRKVHGHVWYKLITFVRCDEQEALAFFLDVLSRSMLSEIDVEGEKAILEVSESEAEFEKQ